MKHFLLLLSGIALFILTTSCEKARQVHLISAHTWVVSDQTTWGVVGDEYNFYDNRLYFQSGSTNDDGKWDFQDNRLDEIYINGDFNNDTYTIILSANELKLIPSFGFGEIILVPKK